MAFSGQAAQQVPANEASGTYQQNAHQTGLAPISAVIAISTSSTSTP